MGSRTLLHREDPAQPDMPRRKIDDATYDLIIEMFMDGIKVEVIALKFGLDPGYIRGLRTMARIPPLRPRLPAEEIIRLYQEERLSTGEIATRLDRSKHSIVQLLRRRGIARRSKAEAQRLRRDRERGQDEPGT